MQKNAISPWTCDAKTHLSTLYHLSPAIFANATVVALVLLSNSRFNFHYYTQCEPTPTQTLAWKWQLQYFETLAQKITKGIHSCKPASLTLFEKCNGLVADCIMHALISQLCCKGKFWTTHCCLYIPAGSLSVWETWWPCQSPGHETVPGTENSSPALYTYKHSGNIGQCQLRESQLQETEICSQTNRHKSASSSTYSSSSPQRSVYLKPITQMFQQSQTLQSEIIHFIRCYKYEKLVDSTND